MNFGKKGEAPFCFYNTANQTIYAIHVKMMGFPRLIFTPFPSEDQTFLFFIWFYHIVFQKSGPLMGKCFKQRKTWVIFFLQLGQTFL